MRVREPVGERTVRVDTMAAEKAMYWMSEKVVRPFADGANHRKALENHGVSGRTLNRPQSKT